MQIPKNPVCSLGNLVHDDPFKILFSSLFTQCHTEHGEHPEKDVYNAESLPTMCFMGLFLAYLSDLLGKED